MFWLDDVGWDGWVRRKACSEMYIFVRSVLCSAGGGGAKPE